MPVITLPDGSQRHFDHPVSPMDVARDIGPGLAKACIAGRVNGELVDAGDLIESDAQLAIITIKDEDGLEIMRHFLRAPAGSCDQAAVAGYQNGDRSGDRQRFLL